MHAPIYNVHDFKRQFLTIPNHRFSYEAFQALYDHFESLDTDETSVAINPHGICALWTEYSQAEFLLAFSPTTQEDLNVICESPDYEVRIKAIIDQEIQADCRTEIFLTTTHSVLVGTHE